MTKRKKKISNDAYVVALGKKWTHGKSDDWFGTAAYGYDDEGHQLLATPIPAFMAGQFIVLSDGRVELNIIEISGTITVTYGNTFPVTVRLKPWNYGTGGHTNWYPDPFISPARFEQDSFHLIESVINVPGSTTSARVQDFVLAAGSEIPMPEPGTILPDPGCYNVGTVPDFLCGDGLGRATIAGTVHYTEAERQVTDYDFRIPFDIVFTAEELPFQYYPCSMFNNIDNRFVSLNDPGHAFLMYENGKNFRDVQNWEGGASDKDLAFMAQGSPIQFSKILKG